MSSASELRRQLESSLAERFPSALSFRAPAPPELFACGIPTVDALLDGGFPLGAISELTGPACSGRTTLALATLAGITRQGDACAYIDASDTFDPASAAALGVDLHRLLWVRAGRPEPPRTDPSPRQPLAHQSAPAVGRLIPGGRGGRHPRAEAIGMDRAVGQLFAAPRSFASSHDAPHPPAFGECGEYASSPDFTPRCSESIRRPRPEPVLFMPPPVPRLPSPPRPARDNSSSALDQAWRATDLLLNTGGFRAIVLDLGDTPPEQARRVPLTTWYRFRLQVEKARVLFLLLTRIPCAGSCSALSICCEAAEADWRQAADGDASPWLLAGVRCHLTLRRNRTADAQRKEPMRMGAPPRAVVNGNGSGWTSVAPWTR